jgi:hypothetical protein
MVIKEFKKSQHMIQVKNSNAIFEYYRKTIKGNQT